MNKKHQLFSTALIFMVFASSVSFYSFRKPGNARVYEPTKDFKFLNNEWVVSRCVTMVHWETNPDLTFDSAGILMNRKTYHPVVISQYALTCFDAYMKTKDEKIKTKFLNQVKYLTDPKFYMQITDDVVGYPYTVAFHDLKPPWYSGLAQAEVLGVLVRYYYLTKDKTVLPLMVKIKNMIILPVSQKGLLDTTPQGKVWIEEYPNSKQHLHVLNGFMVTVLLLDDYCKFFPGDTETRKLTDECFKSIKQSVTYYDSGSWLKYDRGTSSQNVNNWYMKAQVIEADQLYRITRDEFFKKTSLLWSTWCYNKVIGYRGCIIDSINYSVPATIGSDGTLSIQNKYVNKLTAELVKKLSVNRIDTLKQTSKLTDHNDNTTFRLKREKDQAEPPIIEMEFTEALDAQQIEIVSATNLSGKIEFTYMPEGKSKWKSLSILNQGFSSKNNLFTVDAKNIKALRIAFTQLTDNSFVDIGEIKMNMRTGPEESEYVHAQTVEMKNDTDRERFIFDKTPSTEFAVFYKNAATTEALKKMKYNGDSATINSFPEITGKGNVSTFLMVIKRTSDLNAIRNPRLQSLPQ
ncbi:MAG: D-glucuronyl C5-epimerase family protein [Bacteroidia bacterium]